METFEAWYDRTLAESSVTIGITDPAALGHLVALFEASASVGVHPPAQLDAA